MGPKFMILYDGDQIDFLIYYKNQFCIYKKKKKCSCFHRAAALKATPDRLIKLSVRWLDNNRWILM